MQYCYLGPGDVLFYVRPVFAFKQTWKLNFCVCLIYKVLPISVHVHLSFPYYWILECNGIKNKPIYTQHSLLGTLATPSNSSHCKGLG